MTLRVQSGHCMKSGIVVQLVPSPAKKHIQFQAPQSLVKGSLLLRMLQCLFAAEVKLSCVRKHAALLTKEEQLKQMLKQPAESRPQLLRELSFRTLRANPDRMGTWLGHSLSHCLYTQGPYCAALLLKVCQSTGKAAAIVRAVLPLLGIFCLRFCIDLMFGICSHF
jgi:hypothetical protein